MKEYANAYVTNFFLYSLSCLSLNPFSGSHKIEKMLKRELPKCVSDVMIGSFVFFRMNVEIAGKVFSNISIKKDLMSVVQYSSF